jgi:TRAP-type mannitol/chloroaromatic compound transport system permease small subunit
MLGASHVLRVNEHVRVDLVYSLLSVRGKLWTDILGLLLFMLPATIYFLILSWPPALDAWHTGEISPNAGGLVRWPARFALPIGFALLTLQGFSELIKRLAMVTGRITADTHYERPLQ